MSSPPTGASRTSTAKASSPWPAPAHPGSRSSPPPTSAPPLRLSLDLAKDLIGEALELAYRLPRLWDLARDGAVPVWRARQIAQLTHDLSPEGATFADRLLAATPSRLGQLHAQRLFDEARLFVDPDRAFADEENALARRGGLAPHRPHPSHYRPHQDPGDP